MASPQHLRWLALGGHWQLAHPLAALRDRLRRYGYTVYDLGDASHLDRQPPEDHTPYSETGWPATTPYGWVAAIDIMPPPPGSGLPSLQEMGRQIHNDRNAGHPGVAWLKYMNWGPASNTSAVHDSWMPNYVRRSSGDVGHTHLSGRSDHVLTVTAAELAYDPVARLRGLDKGEDMAFLDDSNAAIMAYRMDALAAGSETSRGGPASGEPMAAVKLLHEIKAAVTEPQPAAAPTDEQWAAFTAAVLAKVESAIAAALDPAKLAEAAFTAAVLAKVESAIAAALDPAKLAEAAFQGAQRAERE